MMLNANCFRQPSPGRNPGGDCFACTLKVIIDYCYPEKPISFDDAWECWEHDNGACGNDTCPRKNKDDSKFLGNHWSGLFRALQSAWAKGYYLDWEVDIVYPETNEDRFGHNFGWQVPLMKWHRRVENWLSAGWIIATEMSYEPLDIIKDKGMRNKYGGSDHFIVIDGQRSFWKERFIDGADGTKIRSGTGTYETHVVCSGKGPYWINTEDLHYYHGVNGFYAIRRDKPNVYRDYSWNMDPENQAKIED